MDATEWTRRYASELSVEALSDDDVDTVLALAGEAAHASERTAAPIAFWLAGTTGLSPAEALAAARRVVQQA